MKLTPKQQRFVDEYLIDLNASAALLRAGYKSKNPDVDGHKLLVKPSIQEAVQSRMKDRERRTEISQDRVLEQLAKIAFSDIKDFVSFDDFSTVIVEDKDGNEYPQRVGGIRVKSSDEIDGTMISEISESQHGLKIKRPDQLKALELIGRHLGMFTDKVEHSGVMTSQVIDMSGLSIDELRKLAKEK
ncbi:terminase small subunit [Brevibacillus reuszeri]|uniref:terminase small subunit n=1 Tax=Brevibacillus reuszeri TaxID=54915 RepID=UPI00366B336F